MKSVKLAIFVYTEMYIYTAERRLAVDRTHTTDLSILHTYYLT